MIAVDPAEHPAEFLSLIPAGEYDCLKERVGADGLVDFLGDMPPAGEETILECISEETVQRVLFGMLAGVTGGLSEQDISCLRQEL